MADFPQLHEVHFPGNASPAADTPRNVAPPHPQSAPSYYPLPVPGQPHGYAGVVVPSGVFPPANAAGNRRPDDDWENNRPPVNIAVQGQPQDLQYVDMANYFRANEYPFLHEHRPHVINNAGVALDVPPQAQAAAPAPPEEIVVADNPARHPVADPGHAEAVFDERPDQGPQVPNGPATEILRQLAILLREPNSQGATINMEPGHFRGVRVVISITLDLATH